MSQTNSHSIVSFPSSRLFTMDVGKIGVRKHHIKAMIELDVTEPRMKLKQKRRESGEKLSFTAWILKCIAQSIMENKQIHALRKGKSKLIIFDDVDISILVEKKVAGVPVPLPMIIRNANKKSIVAITAEIENARAQKVSDENDYVLEQDREKLPLKLFALLPQFIRVWIWKLLLSNPMRIKKMMGTVVMTSIGMMGAVKGWFIPYSIHPVCFALGSIIKRPGVHKGKIEVREMLEMTILIDHDVIDGAPAARFVARLVELVEGGFDL